MAPTCTSQIDPLDLVAYGRSRPPCWYERVCQDENLTDYKAVSLTFAGTSTYITLTDQQYMQPKTPFDEALRLQR